MFPTTNFSLINYCWPSGPCDIVSLPAPVQKEKVLAANLSELMPTDKGNESGIVITIASLMFGAHSTILWG